MMETMDDVEFRTRLRGMRLVIRDESKEVIHELAEDLLLIEQSRAEARLMRARLEEMDANRWGDYDDHDFDDRRDREEFDVRDFDVVEESRGRFMLAFHAEKA